VAEFAISVVQMGGVTCRGVLDCEEDGKGKSMARGNGSGRVKAWFRRRKRCRQDSAGNV